jgi:hypothetical protein
MPAARRHTANASAPEWWRQFRNKEIRLMKTYYHTPKIDPNEQTAPHLASLAREIAAHLPGEWQFVPSYQHRATLRDESGLQIGIFPEKGRITLYQESQRGPRNESHFNHWRPAPRITVAYDRPARAIAADMARRLLPDARAAFVDECEYMEHCRAGHERRQAALQLLEQVTGCERSQSFEGHIGLPMLGDVIVHPGGGDIEIKLRYLDLETAASVLELVCSP